MAERSGRWRHTLAACTLGILFVGGGGRAFAEDVALRTALPSELAAETLLQGAARAGNRLVAVGSFGHVVLSDDAGKSWRQAKAVPTRSVLTGVCFADERHGWAVGHDGVVLRSRDGGETWTRQRAEPQDEMPLFSVLCIDASRATAVGAFGLALRTVDGGRAWERFSVGGDEDDLHLNELFQAADDTLYIAAEVGTVYRSRDGGASWETLKTPYDGSYWGGLDVGDGGVLVFGLRGTVMRSEDQGETWTRIDSGTDQSFGGAGVHTDGSIVLGGLSGAFARSADGARSFRAATRPSRLGSRAVLVTRSGRVLFFGEGGVEALEE